MAESLTSKLKLSKRDTGDINWGQGANANLDAVDAHSQQATLRPPRTLSASLGSGAVGANLAGSATYFYKVTAINAVGETTEGQIPAVVEAQITESASPVPVLLSWETVKSATGYKIYKSTTSGQEKFLASVSGESTAIYTDDGNTATNGGISVPATNTARTSVSKIVAGTNVTISPADGTGDVTINAPSSAPTGAAGGDLSGTYPNPAVAKVNGTSVPASPSAGQVLTATSPTAATWQAPAGGYAATVVVAAPSGVAATDTSNITTAFSAANAAGGGTVLLREGTYLINATLTPPTNVTLRGQGRAATTIKASGLSAASIFVDMTNDFSGLRDLTVDANFSVRGNSTALYDVSTSGKAILIDSITFQGPTAASYGCRFASFDTMDVVISNSYFRANGRVSMLGLIFSTTKVYACQIESTTLTTCNAIVRLSGGRLENCMVDVQIAHSTTPTVLLDPAAGAAVIGCTFKVNFANTTAISVTASASNLGVVIANNGTPNTTAVGAITVGAGGTVTVSGNSGFASYTGGNQTGNDTLSFNAVAVSTTAPTTGQVLTATGAAAASWQTPAGGGGYATVVVAAPTGVAATDTANIQNAINGIGNGTVILREGLYVVNTTLTLKSRITIRGQGKGEFGAGAPTTLKCDNAMGDVPLFDTFSLAPLDVSLEDFSIDINGFSRAARSGSYDIRLSGIRPRMLRIAIANSSVHIDVSSNNINEQDSPSIDDCVFVQGKLTAGAWASMRGKIRNCLFVGETATSGLQNALVSFGLATVVSGCVFRTNQDYTTGVIGSTVALDSTASNGRAGTSVHGCMFIQESGTATRAIQVNDGGTGSISIVGNYSATGTNVGSISVRSAGGSGLVTIAGNAGFNGYSGGYQAGNDGQTPINSGAAAGGDLSGTLPNPTVAKVNGVSVPAAPSAGQVLTASGPTAAAWQAPASNWTLVGNITNTAFGQTFTPDFTGLSLATHRSYMLVFELSLQSNAAGPNWVALRLNGAAPTTLQQIMNTDQQGATQDDEGGTNGPAKILKVFPGGGSSVEVCGCIIITGKVNAGFPHAVGWYTVTNQSAVEQMHRGNVGLRMNLGSGVDLTSLGLFSNADLNFLVAGSCRISLYQAQ